MKILFDIGHPAHVHFFGNAIKNLEHDGHEVKITARNKEVALNLLRSKGFDYEDRGEIYTGIFNKALGMLKIDYRILNIAKKFDPDILIGFHNPYIVHVAKILGKRSIIFTDTENVRIASLITFPFADVVCTPTCFRESIDSKKHVTFNGYKELAYLHPNYFVPDPSVPEKLGISRNEKYVVVRLISWQANHDINLKGIKQEEEFIKKLENYGRVILSSERKTRPELEKYIVDFPPESFHSLLSFAQLYIGEGGTITTEAALLGTPAIHIESNSKGEATGLFSGNFNELREKYNLIYFYPDEHSAIQKARELLNNPNIKSEWLKKRDALLTDKIDVTEWMTRFIEEYPIKSM